MDLRDEVSRLEVAKGGCKEGGYEGDAGEEASRGRFRRLDVNSSLVVCPFVVSAFVFSFFVISPFGVSPFVLIFSLVDNANI